MSMTDMMESQKMKHAQLVTVISIFRFFLSEQIECGVNYFCLHLQHHLIGIGFGIIRQVFSLCQIIIINLVDSLTRTLYQAYLFQNFTQPFRSWNTCCCQQVVKIDTYRKTACIDNADTFGTLLYDNTALYLHRPMSARIQYSFTNRIFIIGRDIQYSRTIIDML